MGNPFKLFGETGRFPRGKLNASDEGEIQLGVTTHGGTVILAFGKEVAWLGLPPQQARELARALIAKADEATKAQ